MGKKSRERKPGKEAAAAVSAPLAPSGQGPSGNPSRGQAPGQVRTMTLGLGLALALLLVYGAGVALRFVGLGPWLAGSHQVGGEMLLTTNDAYAWLAGAVGAGRYAGSFLSEYLALGSRVLGVSPGNLAFWTPVFVAPLAGLPLVLLGAAFRQTEAGLTAGVMAAVCTGYLRRSSFGYFDNDVLALFFPVLVAAGLVLFLDRVGGAISPGDRVSRADAPGGAGSGDSPLVPAWLLAALGLGLACRLWIGFYSSGRPIFLALLAGALGLGLWRSRPGQRVPVVLGLALAAGLGGSLAFGGAAWAAVALAWRRWPDRVRTPAGWAPLLGLAVLATVFGSGDLIQFLSFKFAQYGKTALPAQGGGGLSLPVAGTRVSEAMNPDPALLVRHLAGNGPVLALGLAGLAFLAVQSPSFLVFLPLLGIGLAGHFFGVRFAMYGSPALAVGLGFGLNRVALALDWPALGRWAVQVLASLLLVLLFLSQARTAPVAPIFSNALAATCLELKEAAPRGSLVWTWWDYGYPVQYFAGLDTVADGSRHNAPNLYPLALALGSDSPAQAAGIMRQAFQGLGPDTDRRVSRFAREQAAVLYAGDPVRFLRDLGPARAKERLEALRTEAAEPVPSAPRQYLMVSWDQVNILGAISHFASWDLATGANREEEGFWPLGSAFNVTREGILQTGKDSYPLSRALSFDTRMNQRLSWERKGGFSFLVNTSPLDARGCVMKEELYRSNLVQMLLGDPQGFAPHFRLVVERFPLFRVYELQ